MSSLKDHYDFLVVGTGLVGLMFAYSLSSVDLKTKICMVADNSRVNTSMMSAGMISLMYAADEITNEDEVHDRVELLDEIEAALVEIERKSGMDLSLRKNGSIFLSVTEGDMQEILRIKQFYREIGVDAELLSGDECRRRYRVSSAVEIGLINKSDISVDTAELVQALLKLLKRRGVDFCFGKVCSYRGSGDATSLLSISLNSGIEISSGNFVFATGAWSKSGYPIRGSLLEVREDHTTANTPMLRGCRSRNNIYVIRRGDRSTILGATFKNVGYRSSTELSEVYDLLKNSFSLLPSLESAELISVKHGFRAMSYSNKIEYNRLRNFSNTVEIVGHYRDTLLYSKKIAQEVLRTLSIVE